MCWFEGSTICATVMYPAHPHFVQARHIVGAYIMSVFQVFLGGFLRTLVACLAACLSSQSVQHAPCSIVLWQALHGLCRIIQPTSLPCTHALKSCLASCLCPCRPGLHHARVSGWGLPILLACELHLWQGAAECSWPLLLGGPCC